MTSVNMVAIGPEDQAENVWQFPRGNWLSNRILSTYDAIVDHCCHAWTRLADHRRIRG